MAKSVVNNLRIIKIGESKTFTVEHPKEIDTYRATAYRLNSTEPERKYSCVSNFSKRQITIEVKEP